MTGKEDKNKKDLTHIGELSNLREPSMSDISGVPGLESPPQVRAQESDFEPLENSLSLDPIPGTDSQSLSIQPPIEQATQDDFAPFDHFGTGVTEPKELTHKTDLTALPEAVQMPDQTVGKIYSDPLSDPTLELPVDTLGKVQQYAQNITATKVSVPAAFPFSLLIEGPLTPEEKEKLLDLIARENLGIREVDLEPQLQANRVLIPRISEYAGVLLVQALRGTTAALRFGPSDSIFSTVDTHAAPEDAWVTPESKSTQTIDQEHLHPADALPITSDTAIPGLINYKIIDVISASASLRTSVIEAEHSSEYQDAIDALQRELKYRALRRGASAILNYSVQLTPLDLPSHYRLMVSGTAIRSNQ